MKGYLEKAKHNEEFLNLIKRNSSSFHDWQITVTFYISLHYMNAFIKSLKIIPENNHTKFFRQVEKKASKEIYQIYSDLFALSRTSRYNTIYNNDFAIKMQKANAKIAEQGMKKVKVFVTKEISTKSK